MKNSHPLLSLWCSSLLAGFGFNSFTKQPLICFSPKKHIVRCINYVLFAFTICISHAPVAIAEIITTISNDMYIKEYEERDLARVLPLLGTQKVDPSLLAKKELWLRSRNDFSLVSMRLNVSSFCDQKTIGISFNVIDIGKKNFDNTLIQDKSKSIVKYKVDDRPYIIDHWAFAAFSDWFSYHGYIQPGKATSNYIKYVENSESFIDRIRDGKKMRIIIELPGQTIFQSDFDISELNYGLTLMQNKCDAQQSLNKE